MDTLTKLAGITKHQNLPDKGDTESDPRQYSKKQRASTFQKLPEKRKIKTNTTADEVVAMVDTLNQIIDQSMLRFDIVARSPVRQSTIILRELDSDVLLVELTIEEVENIVGTIFSHDGLLETMSGNLSSQIV